MNKKTKKPNNNSNNKQVSTRLVKNIEIKPTKEKIVYRNSDLIAKQKLKENVQVLSNARNSNMKLYNPVVNDTASNKYKVPELNSALNLVKEIEQIRNLKISDCNQGKNKGKQQQLPASDEVSRCLNLPINNKVFNHLVPLNVNDSILIPETIRPIKKKYFIKSDARDPEPDIGDFLEKTKLYKESYKLKRFNEPEVFIKPNIDNFNEIYQLCDQYHPES